MRLLSPHKFFLLCAALSVLATGAHAKNGAIPVPQEKPPMEIPPEALQRTPSLPPADTQAGIGPAPADNMPSGVATAYYFPALPFDAAPDTEPQMVPLAANHDIEGDHRGITNAIIVIPDFSRDAQAAVSTMSALAGSNNSTTIIISPQFLLDFDITRFGTKLPEHGRMFARWSLSGWEYGGDSLASQPSKPISAFTVVDLLLMYLAVQEYFPDLKQITVAGHGTGGDFVQRYAVASRAVGLFNFMNRETPRVNFLVANASSYLYLTSLRPQSRGSGFVNPLAPNCPAFDSYPYGLQKLNDYARRIGATAMKMDYASRNITYLVGEKVATSDPMPDISCPAMLEGPDRVNRAMNYNVYLYQAFGAEMAKNQKFATVPKVAYNAGAMFGSACGMSVLFGDGACTAQPITNAGNQR